MNVNMMIYRMEIRIEWAYRSSDNAERFGFGKTGCWVVEQTDWTPAPQTPVALRGFAYDNKAGAIEYATSLHINYAH